MKNKKLFQKIVFITLIVLILLSLVAPAIFSQTLLAPRQEKLLNGLKVLMWSDAKAEKVTVRIRVHSGSAFDPQGKEGVMQLLADNIFPNAASREFFTEDLGGGLEVVTNYDYIQINASSKPEGFLSMLETLSTAVSNPAIDKETTIKLRTALLAKIATMESDPAYVADNAVAKRLFGTFPYGRPQLGTAISVQKLDFADLIDAKQRFLTADNATIAVSGNFDKALGYKAIRRYFGGWLKSDKKVPSTFRQPDDPDTKQLAISVANSGKTEYRFAFRGVARSDKDYIASHLLSRILQARALGMFRGSSNSVEKFSVSNNVHSLPGFFVLNYSGKPEPTAPAVNIDLVSELFHPKISDSEFAKARSEILSENAAQSISDWWLDVDTYRIVVADEARSFQSASIADVQRVADRLSRNPVVSVKVSG